MTTRRLSARTIITFAVFALLLLVSLARAVPHPGNLDSVICATSVAEFRPGFLDGKPLYAFFGQPVRGLNALLGGGRADLMLALARWSALFGWGSLVLLFLLALEIHRSAARAWAAVALLATTPIYVFFSAVAEKYTLQVFFLLLAVLLWLRRRYVLWGLAWGAAIGAHLTSILLVIPCLLSLRRDPDRRGDTAPALKGLLGAAVVTVPLYLWVLSFAVSAGAYIDSARQVVFGDYDFLKALRPDRLAGTILARPAAGALIVLVIAAGAALVILWRRGRRGGPAPQAERDGGPPGPGPIWRGTLPAILGLAAAAVVAVVYSRNLGLLLAQTGSPLVALALLRPILIGLSRLRIRWALPLPERIEPLTSSFVLPWLITNAVFFTIWDHFWGQFSILIAPPLALIAAGIGSGAGAGSTSAEEGRRRAALAAALVLTAVFAAAWRSRGVMEQNTWTLVTEYDAEARAAAAIIPERSLVVAAWDSASLMYYRPDLEIVRLVSGAERRMEVWKGVAVHNDIAGDVRRAVQEGRRVFVTSRWLDLKLDAAAQATRDQILMQFDRIPAGETVSELVPRRS